MHSGDGSRLKKAGREGVSFLVLPPKHVWVIKGGTKTSKETTLALCKRVRASRMTRKVGALLIAALLSHALQVACDCCETSLKYAHAASAALKAF